MIKQKKQPLYIGTNGMMPSRKRLSFFFFSLLLLLSPKQSFCQEIEDGPDAEFIFVVLAHVKTPTQDNLWRQSCNSIQKFHPDIPIILIDDHSNYPISIDEYENITLLDSEYPGAGELLPYYYFLKYQWAKKMIFLHDSMHLTRAFTPEELSGHLKFHWHFTASNYDNKQNIRELLAYFHSADELLYYYDNQRQDFYGCFGVTSIIDLPTLKYLEEKYRWTDILKDLIQTREQRMSLERIFGLICFKEELVQKENCSNYGDIHQDYLWPKVPYTGAIQKSLVGR